ncbi:MAG: aminoglycoside phosphotransferase family protein [Pseudonocardiales bacterium]|nr:aminoglycoside phosphotransferase family protein [Pseudonocardiales bacterium]
MTLTNGKSFDAEAHELATRFGAEHPELIAKGTEAHVYELASDRVLKIYSSPDALPGIEALYEFYERASTRQVSYAIPRIREYGQAESVAYSVEDRLVGIPMADITGFIEKPHMADLYIEAVLDIRRISVSPPYLRRKLLGADEPSGDWNEYIRSEITRKSDALRATLPEEVFAKFGPVNDLVRYFAVPYSGADLLIHGDFHPGNVLVTGGNRVAAVVDFGAFTMFGDPLYDIATACGFFSMYEPDQLATRKRILERLFQKDATLDCIRVHAYLLAAALLTCDLYPDEGILIYKTGHFDWALSVLGDTKMWDGISV